jgi:hypothetical protein
VLEEMEMQEMKMKLRRDLGSSRGGDVLLDEKPAATTVDSESLHRVAGFLSRWAVRQTQKRRDEADFRS